MLTFEKNFIEFHREFYFWERFEKRVFPTDPLSRTDTFGTHCIRRWHALLKHALDWSCAMHCAHYHGKLHIGFRHTQIQSR